MKKKVMLIFSAITITCLLFIGCGGSGNGRSSDYYYKWSNGSAALASARPLSRINSVVYADDDGPTFLGAEIPPFSAVDDTNKMCGTLLIITYYNNVEVKSTCAVDPNDGEITEYDLTGGHMVPSFIANRQGLFHVTASYNGETLDVPVRIYHFCTTDLDGVDLDGDGTRDINNLVSVYGYQVINNTYFSLVTSAPEGIYSPNTPLPQFEFGKIYVIKTSDGRYCKIYPTGYAGENDYNGMDFMSDENGDFAY